MRWNAFKLGFLPFKHQPFSWKISLNSCLTGLDQLHTGRAGGISEGKALNKVLSHSPYSTSYSGASIKRSAKRLCKFVLYIEHLDATNCISVIAVMLSVLFLFFAVNMHLSACWESVFFCHSRCVCGLFLLYHLTPPTKGKVMLKAPKIK